MTKMGIPRKRRSSGEVTAFWNADLGLVGRSSWAATGGDSATAPSVLVPLARSRRERSGVGGVDGVGRMDGVV